MTRIEESILHVVFALVRLQPTHNTRQNSVINTTATGYGAYVCVCD